MKLSIEKYEGYANTPEFKIDWGTIEFDEPMVIPYGESEDSAWFLQFNYDQSILNFRMLCRSAAVGNTNYGYEPAGYLSGWSSNVAAINMVFGYKMVEVSNYGINLDKFLYLLQDTYVGDVFIARRVTDYGTEYMVQPYFKDKADSYAVLGKHLIIHTIEPEFIELCMEYLTDVNHMLKVADGVYSKE